MCFGRAAAPLEAGDPTGPARLVACAAPGPEGETAQAAINEIAAPASIDSNEGVDLFMV
jgi:hypothetical protein